MQTKLLALLVLLLFTGCSKVAVFEPKKVEKRVGYKDRLSSEIIASSPFGVTLADHSVMTSDDKFVIEKGFVLIGSDGDLKLFADRFGKMLITDGVKSYDFELDSRVLAASTDGKVVAITTQNNDHRVVDLDSRKLLFVTQEKLVTAIDERVARALIGKNQIIFPTLDGKVLIVSRDSYKITSEAVVSTEQFFGNVIFLAEHENHIVAASQDKILSISSKNSQKIVKKDIKLLTLLDGELYLFALDGKVSRLTGDLLEIDTIDVPFAKFVAAVIAEGSIYAVEQSGWIVKITKDMSSYKVYELPDEITMPLFATKKELYYGRKVVGWR